MLSMTGEYLEFNDWGFDIDCCKKHLYGLKYEFEKRNYLEYLETRYRYSNINRKNAGIELLNSDFELWINEERKNYPIVLHFPRIWGDDIWEKFDQKFLMRESIKQWNFKEALYLATNKEKYRKKYFEAEKDLHNSIIKIVEDKFCDFCVQRKYRELKRHVKKLKKFANKHFEDIFYIIERLPSVTTQIIFEFEAFVKDIEDDKGGKPCMYWKKNLSKQLENLFREKGFTIDISTQLSSSLLNHVKLSNNSQTDREIKKFIDNLNYSPERIQRAKTTVHYPIGKY